LTCCLSSNLLASRSIVGCWLEANSSWITFIRRRTWLSLSSGVLASAVHQSQLAIQTKVALTCWSESASLANR
jgi:hypothetical protein